MGTADEGAEQGGCVCPDLGPDLLGVGPVGHDLWFRDMGDDPPHWNIFGRVQPQGGPQPDRGETSVREEQRTGIPPSGGRNDGGCTAGGRDLHILPPEHSHTVYCDQAHYGPVSGGGAEARVKGSQAVVVSGRVGCGGYADSGSGGGMGGGGIGDGWYGDVDRLSRWEDHVAIVTLGTEPNSLLVYAL